MSKSKTPFDLLEDTPSKQKYIDYFEKLRWNGNVISPYNSSSKVYKCANNWYKCKITGKRFNVKTGTILAHTKLPLRKWYLTWCFFSVKKGISSHQLAKSINVTQTTAWNLLKDVRSLLRQLNFVKDMLKNEVAIDETLIGGKNKNRHKNKKVPHSQGRSWKDKVPVLGILEKGGNLITQVVPNVQMRTLVPIIKANVKEGSILNTDEWYVNSGLGKWYKHQIVNHSAKQYVNGKASTNSAENVWTHFKNLIHGTYHNNVSDKYLQNYADEFTFRFNTKKWSEQNRFDSLVSTVYQEFNQPIEVKQYEQQTNSLW